MFKKLILCWGLLLCTVFAFAQDFPEKSSTLVTDYTNTLSDGDKQRLESKLVAFNDSTTTQIAVVLIKSVGSYDINQYAALLGRKWGVGSKEKNNGIVILVAIGDRKVAIQTGYGAEGAVPDGVTHDIIENDIKPRFKAGDYAGGLDAATDQLIKYMKGEYKASSSPKNNNGRKHRDGGGSSAGFIIIVIVFVIIMAIRRRGGGGGGGHIIGSRGGASPFWWFLAGSALGRSSGGGGWGGFSGGGDSGGGGGGGFGGFGGGSFGGGGSSGSW
jgi:uncharacterized protein